MSEFAERLRALRLAPSSSLSDDDFVARVMTACKGAASTPSARAPTKRAPWVCAAALAVAASVAVGVSVWPAQTPLGRVNASETITARGASGLGLAATVQAFVGHAEANAAPPLLEGATLRPGDGVLVRYSNPTSSDVYLMVFALDEQRVVHWLHPAYLAESTNPSSLKLARQVSQRVLPEVAEPENPAEGALHVYALLSATPLDVKGVERRLASANRSVPELFSEAEVEEWRCTWRAK